MHPRHSFEHPTVRRLADGATLAFRPVGTADVRAVDELVGRCTCRSLRNRFFGYSGSPSEVLAGHVRTASAAGCAVGAFDDRLLVAIATGLPVGDPQRDETEHVWELGLLVADQWQHRGIGTELADLVVAAAASAAVRSVVAHVEESNIAAIGLVRGLRRSYGAFVRTERH